MAKQGINSVFTRLFALFLALIVIVFTVLTGFFVTYVGQQRRVDMSGQINRVTNSASVIEQQLRAVVNVETQLFNDTRLARLAHKMYGDAYEKTELILGILGTIQTTQSINSIIKDIVVAIPNSEIELSAVNGYHRRGYDLTDFQLARSSAGNYLVLRSNQLEMNVASPLVISLEENYIPDFMIRIVLSADYLSDYLDSFRNRNLEGAFWVLAGENTTELLFSESDSEKGLLEDWSREWRSKGAPAFYAEKTRCERGEYLFVSQYMDAFNLTLVTYQNSLALAWELKWELMYMLGAIIIMVVFSGAIVVWANHSVNKPIQEIMAAFAKVSSGNMDVRIYHEKKDEFGYIYDAFNDTVAKIKELIENLSEQKVLLHNAELMQLQSQINPHFLYNSFYNIKFLAHNEEYEQIETFVTALARYYRFINKETELDVALSSEVGHMENYIEIQQMRFGDKITVEKEVLPAEVGDFKVPKLILQPIIENAYNYGLKDKLEGGRLFIRYRMEGELLCIEIEDNGGAMNPEKLRTMQRQMQTFEGDALNHALTNIHRRLILAYGGQCGITLEIGGAGGLRVVLRLDTSVRL